ncbi:hypothetical protein [Sphingobacterium griseoflavum]
MVKIVFEKKVKIQPHVVGNARTLQEIYRAYDLGFGEKLLRFCRLVQNRFFELVRFANPWDRYRHVNWEVVSPIYARDTLLIFNDLKSRWEEL